ncbi:hypothetical protein ES695_00300 [Candidatus Atribacteria bacterium 1244-E10-H5-B2]|nr:MAG: hypothetical protein ES695_00300 [Candidatus Atribacteria bacterium 1244-E10-H5-B2]
MKTIFIKDNRLRKIIADRNKKIERLLLTGKLRGSCYTKLSIKEFKGGIHFGWEITDLENGKVEKRFGEKEGKIEPSGTMIPQKDWFKPAENIGVFKKGD